MGRSDKIVMFRAPSGKPQEFNKRRLGTLLRETFASTNLYNHYGFAAVERMIDCIANDLWETIE